jgi:CBS domain-containing protein
MHQPRLARDVMVTDLVTLHPEGHVCDGMSQLLRAKISGAPVVDNDHNYLGVFSEKCCMSALILAARMATASGQFDADSIRIRDFMVTKLVTLSPDMDVVEAIGILLKHRISGAPVLEPSGKLLGVLSERGTMRLLLDAAYDQLPTSHAEPFINRDLGRIVSEEANLVDVARSFLMDHYRRLIVLRDDKLAGQISRRDVLSAGQGLAHVLRKRESAGIPLPEDVSDLPESVKAATSLGSGQFPTLTIAGFMDTDARTVTEETDLLSIAQVFLSTNYRRLPVLRDGKVLGQVSRRDVLKAIYDLMAVAKKREVALLYLSSLIDREDAPISQ